ncbi:MAG TPA: TonB family protein [Polyangiaceae bacterium]
MLLKFAAMPLVRNLLGALPFGARGVTLAASLCAHGAFVASAALHVGSHPALAGAPALIAAPELDAEPRDEPPALRVSDVNAATSGPRADARVAMTPPPRTAPRTTPSERSAGAAAVAVLDAETSDVPSDVSGPRTPSAPRFAMTVQLSAPMQSTAAAGGGASGGQHAAVWAETLIDEPARLVKRVPIAYTAAARAAGVEASVPLEIVVSPSGAVASARSLTTVGYGLDEAALDGVRQYRFAPARRAGLPVAVRMRFTVSFELL